MIARGCEDKKEDVKQVRSDKSLILFIKILEVYGENVKSQKSYLQLRYTMLKY